MKDIVFTIFEHWPLLLIGLIVGIIFIVRNQVVYDKKYKKLDQEIYRLKEINKAFKDKYNF